MAARDWDVIDFNNGGFYAAAFGVPLGNWEFPHIDCVGMRDLWLYARANGYTGGEDHDVNMVETPFPGVAAGFTDGGSASLSLVANGNQHQPQAGPISPFNGVAVVQNSGGTGTIDVVLTGAR